MQELTPKNTILSTVMKPGQNGIDLLAEFDIRGVDHYVMIEAKAGPYAKPGMTLDGPQGSWGWMIGETTGRDAC